MNQYLPRLLFTSMCLSGFLLPALFVSQSAIAACQVQSEQTAQSDPQPGNNPTTGQTIACIDNLDSEGINGPTANQVTVDVQSPSGGISTTGQPGIILGEFLRQGLPLLLS